MTIGQPCLDLLMAISRTGAPPMPSPSLVAAAFAAVLCFAAAAGPAPPHGTCEQRDGDCPSPCPAGQGSLGATLLVQISSLCGAAGGLCKPAASAFARAATIADAIIAAHSSSNGSDIVSYDSPASGLHTSVLYTCCHTAAELLKLRGVLRSLRWSAFAVNYSDAGCNLDMHGSGIVYLHAMPDAAGQQRLLNLTRQINGAMAAAGVAVHHPRRSKFHMTLARVKRSFEADAAVAALRSEVFAGAGLQLLLCRFEALGEVFEAEGGCPPDWLPLKTDDAPSPPQRHRLHRQLAAAVPAALSATLHHRKATLHHSLNLVHAAAPPPAPPAAAGLRPTPAQFGGDPTGKADSTAAVNAALAVCLAAANRTVNGRFSVGSKDAGGCVLDLDGGEYLLSAPLVIPPYYSNLQVADGSLVADPHSSTWRDTTGKYNGGHRYLIEIGESPTTEACVDHGPLKEGSCNEAIGLRGLFLDGRHAANGVLIGKVMGTTIGQSYLLNFTTYGIVVNKGHEVMIDETWLGEVREPNRRGAFTTVESSCNIITMPKYHLSNKANIHDGSSVCRPTSTLCSRLLARHEPLQSRSTATTTTFRIQSSSRPRSGCKTTAPQTSLAVCTSGCHGTALVLSQIVAKASIARLRWPLTTEGCRHPGE